MKFRFPTLTSIKQHKIRTLLVVGLVIGAGLVVKRVTTPPELTRALVVRQTMTEVVEASGRVKARESVSLSFPAGSRITWVGVKKGDHVRKWQAVASVDRRELEKEVKKVLLDYQTTRWNFEQMQDDYDVNGRSLSAMTLTDKERRILEKSQFGLDQAVLDYEIARLSMEQATLISPIEGTVTDTGNLTAGERLVTADALSRSIKVTNLNSLYFQADLDETDYAKVKEGMRVIVHLDSYPAASFSGTVTYIGKEGVKKTGGSVQIPVEIAIASPTTLIPELTGEAQIITAEKPVALILDKKYVTKKGDEYTVQVMTNGKLTTKTIQTGLVNGKTIEVMGGLAEGDEVVILAK